MTVRDAAAALTPFGFTGLESEIYAFLLSESPATGYRISQAIGKPVANTYKAIQTLQAKGALVVEEGDTRQCVPVPSEELLERLGREFEVKRAAAKDALSRIGGPEADERIYQIRARTQAIHRAREMLDAVREVAILSGPKEIVSQLSDELAAASARGVDVYVKTDGEVAVAGVETFIAVRQDDLLHHVDMVRLVTDGDQHLVGYVGTEDDTEVVWSRNLILSLAHHEGLAAEISLLSVAARIEDGAGAKRVVKALTQARVASQTPGFERL